MESNSMAIPVYLWLKDDGGADIKGSVDVQDREGSIEVVAQEHNLYIPTDNNTGKLTGTRIHTPFLFTKEIDSSSPYLYKAVTTGQTLKVCGIQVVQNQRRGPGSGVLQHQTGKREGGESES
jgi:type VI secretion system secreted protein Hcp